MRPQATIATNRLDLLRIAHCLAKVAACHGKRPKRKPEDHVKAHNGVMPSVKFMAEIVGCSRPTIDKAIGTSEKPTVMPL